MKQQRPYLRDGVYVAPSEDDTEEVRPRDRVELLGLAAIGPAADAELDALAARLAARLGVVAALVLTPADGPHVWVPGLCRRGDAEHGAYLESRVLPAPLLPLPARVLEGTAVHVDDAAESGEPLGPVTAAGPTYPAYAAAPVLVEGRLVAVVGALHDAPRPWTPADLAALGEAAEETALRVRLRALDRARERERDQHERFAAWLQVDRYRQIRLMGLLERLNRAASVPDIARALASLARDIDGFETVRLRPGDDLDRFEAVALPVRSQPPASPAVLTAARTGRLVTAADLLRPEDEVGLASARHYEHSDAAVKPRGVVCLPVPGPGRPRAVVEMLWSVPRRIEDSERAILARIAEHVEHALIRVGAMDRSATAVQQLQRALLHTVPEVAGLDVAATYVPANADDRIGGDWYDVVVLPTDHDREAPAGEWPGGDGCRRVGGRPDRRRTRGRGVITAPRSGREPDPLAAVAGGVMLTVGDVVGHDLQAAAQMGQVRAMLRQAMLDRPGASPAGVLRSFDTAVANLGLGTCGSAVLGRLSPLGPEGWDLTWSSAGHPEPLLLHPEGLVEPLQLSAQEQGTLFGYPELSGCPRADVRHRLAPGSTLLLLTDGATDVRGIDPEHRQRGIADALVRSAPGGSQAVVDTLASRFGGSEDDLVAVAVQVPPN